MMMDEFPEAKEASVASLDPKSFLSNKRLLEDYPDMIDSRILSSGREISSLLKDSTDPEARSVVYNKIKNNPKLVNLDKMDASSFFSSDLCEIFKEGDIVRRFLISGGPFLFLHASKGRSVLSKDITNEYIQWMTEDSDVFPNYHFETISNAKVEVLQDPEAFLSTKYKRSLAAAAYLNLIVNNIHFANDRVVFESSYLWTLYSKLFRESSFKVLKMFFKAGEETLDLKGSHFDKKYLYDSHESSMVGRAFGGRSSDRLVCDFFSTVFVYFYKFSPEYVTKMFKDFLVGMGTADKFLFLLDVSEKSKLKMASVLPSELRSELRSAAKNVFKSRYDNYNYVVETQTLSLLLRNEGYIQARDPAQNVFLGLHAVFEDVKDVISDEIRDRVLGEREEADNNQYKSDEEGSFEMGKYDTLIPELSKNISDCDYFIMEKLYNEDSFYEETIRRLEEQGYGESGLLEYIMELEEECLGMVRDTDNIFESKVPTYVKRTEDDRYYLSERYSDEMYDNEDYSYGQNLDQDDMRFVSNPAVEYQEGTKQSRIKNIFKILKSAKIK